MSFLQAPAIVVVWFVGSIRLMRDSVQVATVAAWRTSALEASELDKVFAVNFAGPFPEDDIGRTVIRRRTRDRQINAPPCTMPAAAAAASASEIWTARRRP